MKGSQRLPFFCRQLHDAWRDGCLFFVFGAVEPVGQNKHAEKTKHQKDGILNVHGRAPSQRLKSRTVIMTNGPARV
jgi:hypothetical protein